MRWRVYLAIHINVLSVPLISSIVIGLDNLDLESIDLDGLFTGSNPAILAEDQASNDLTPATSDLSSGYSFDPASSTNQSPRGQASSSGSSCSVDHGEYLEAMQVFDGLQLHQRAESEGACGVPGERESQQNNIVNFDESIPIRSHDDDYEELCPIIYYRDRQKAVCDSGNKEDIVPDKLYSDGRQDFTLWFVRRLAVLDIGTYNPVE